MFDLPQQDLVTFKADSITDEIEDNVKDDDLELNKEVLGVSLGSHSIYPLYIYTYTYIHMYMYIHISSNICFFLHFCICMYVYTYICIP